MKDFSLDLQLSEKRAEQTLALLCSQPLWDVLCLLDVVGGTLIVNVKLLLFSSFTGFKSRVGFVL